MWFRFAFDLVSHQADWRGGLAWMLRRYPQFFDPPIPGPTRWRAAELTRAMRGPVDVERLKRMAFRINWKVGNDYACMGMFLPPLANPDDRWERVEDE